MKREPLENLRNVQGNALMTDSEQRAVELGNNQETWEVLAWPCVREHVHRYAWSAAVTSPRLSNAGHYEALAWSSTGSVNFRQQYGTWLHHGIDACWIADTSRCSCSSNRLNRAHHICV